MEIMNQKPKMLLNSINYTTLQKQVNSTHTITREELLKNYNEETISSAWEVFCKSIQKNYQSGKGTVIPNFGLFTFKNPEVNFEGMTNQLERDIKPRIPIFIMSHDFLDFIKPALFINGTLIQYTQTLNNSISHVKISFAELSNLINLNKSDYGNIINNCLKLISDSIIKKAFYNKDLPHLGALIYRNGLLGVNFKESLVNLVKELPQKLIELKKIVHLYMERSADRSNGKNKKMTETLGDFKRKNAKFNESEDLRIDRNTFNTSKFLNDFKLKKNKKLGDLGIKNDIFELIFFKRNEILVELKLKVN